MYKHIAFCIFEVFIHKKLVKRVPVLYNVAILNLISITLPHFVQSIQPGASYSLRKALQSDGSYGTVEIWKEIQ